ncbi:HEAT repeat domain-containing protein [Planktothrix agardhii]|uniref:HEAT repeat domain-containing protein n=1 Tax=Planktothrix agardhii TaxID=1160 RepID=UPI001D0A9884|nr:HEAT repeat domain-containing protein [Planktothrix agardhii]MCB8752876.1 HEAT repeat domain-containing protein [Planktothrix agardhii 1810]
MTSNQDQLKEQFPEAYRDFEIDELLAKFKETAKTENIKLEPAAEVALLGRIYRYDRKTIASKGGYAAGAIGQVLSKQVYRTMEVLFPSEDKRDWQNIDFPELLKQFKKNIKPSTIIDIDWYNVCQAILARQQKQQQIRRKATEMGFEVKVYVPLGLVERKQQQRRSEITNTEQIDQLDPEVITQIYKHQEFLDDIIGQQPTDQDQHIAIIGEPGAGKTTLLDRIATYIKDKNQDLFICISLANLQGRPLKTYILKEWLPKAIALSYPEFDPESLEKTFQHRLNQGGVWLLLDGADEGKLSLPEIQTELSNFVKIRVVLTCRTNVWDTYVNNPLTRFKTYKTQEFKPEQIDQFIQGWFEQAKDEIRGKELQAKLKESQRDRIRQLVTNPLRLALLCQIFYKDKNAELPETKAGLYEQFVRYFYEWKPAITGINWGTQPQLQDELHQGLGKLAIAGLDSNYRYRLPLSLIKTEMDDKLFKIAWDLGWLTLVDREEKTDEVVYAFYHPTFQEYFAALAIKDKDWDYFLPRNHENCPVEGKEYRIFQPQWKQAILLWLGRDDVNSGEKEAFIQKLVNFDEGCGDSDFYCHRAYLLAAAGINEFKECSLSDEIVKQIVKWGFGYLNIEKQKWQTFLDPIQESARTVLPETIRKNAIANLIQVLETAKDEYTRWGWDFAHTLGEIAVGNELAIRELIRVLESTEDENTRGRVANTLGEIDPGNELAIRELIRVLETTEDESTRWDVAHDLGKIAVGNELAIQVLIRVLETTENESTRKGVAYNLGKIDPGNELAIRELIQVLETTEDEDTRRGAYSLGEIAVGNELAIRELIRVLETTENESTRSTVAYSLGEIAVGNELAIRELIQVLETTESEDTCWGVAYNLGKIDPGNELAIRELIRVLETTESESTRWWLGYSLGEIAVGNELAIRELIQVLETTEDEDNRRGVAYTLGKIDPGNELAIRELIRVLETTESESTRWWLGYSLGEIAVGNELAIRELIRVLETTESEDNRRGVAYTLGKIDPGNELAIRELIRVLETTENESTRWGVASNLGKIDPENELAIRELIRVLETTENESTRSTVAESLGKIIKTEKQYTDVVFALNHNLTDEVYENDFDLYKNCYELLWQCTQNLTYPKFYQAWHESDTTKEQLETSYNDLTEILKQLQPNDQVYPFLIDGKYSLENLTDESAIAQELCNQIYYTILPDDDIPTVKNAPELKRLFPKFKRQLNRLTLVFIIYNIEPYPELINVCRQLLGKFHIAFITDQQIEPDLRGFPMQNNLVNILQNWLTEISYKETL